ncbi:FlgO family outer membrane protein [Candidatus Halobeggiatoa sp. HSG11]|nr:FlgO family outer membrane protein [Candidatus Halobeggiatoa sp. HSG11]
MNIKLLFVVLLLSFMANGCGQRVAFGGCDFRVKSSDCHQNVKEEDANLIATSYAAADKLMQGAVPVLSPETNLLVTSIADIDNLDYANTLGRLLGEQIAARLTQRGHIVTEAKFNDNLKVIPRNGEFVLSRDLRELENYGWADMVVTGTYAVGKDKVYITLKLLDFATSKAISSYAYTLPKGKNTLTLLQKSDWWW